jgi:hypothetical protein
MIKSKSGLVSRIKLAIGQKIIADSLDDTAKAADEKKNPVVTQVRSTHKKYALQIYKKLSLPKDIPHMTDFVLAAFAMSLAQGTTPITLYKMYKPGSSLMKSFMNQMTKRISNTEKEEGTKPSAGHQLVYDN